MNNIFDIKLKNEKNLLSIEGVTGVGLDRINNKIIVYVENQEVVKKVPLSLAEFEIEFKILPQPHLLQSSCVDTNRPLIGGICFGVVWYEGPDPINGKCGTLGAVVRDKTTHQEFLLTNRHVITDLEGLPVIDVINPCQFYGEVCGGTDMVTPEGYPLVDGALVNPLVDTQRIIKSIGEITGADHPQIDMNIKKYGATSGLTSGIITDIDFASWIDGVYYSDQILSDMEAISGDSGSIVLNNENKAIGLLFAGAPGIAIVNKINNVVELFNIYFNNPDELPSLLPELPERESILPAMGAVAYGLLVSASML